MRSLPQLNRKKYVGFGQSLHFYRAFGTSQVKQNPESLHFLQPPIGVTHDYPKNPLGVSQHYSPLIRECAERKSMTDLTMIHTQMLKSGFPQGLGYKLIEGFIKCGSVDDARKLFDELPQRYAVTWNSMISSYINHKRSEEAVKLYGRMILEGITPDEFTLSIIFKAFTELGLVREGQIAHGLSVVLGLEVSNVFVSSALVDMYAKFEKMRDARLVSDRAVEKDVVLITALIVGYSQCGEDGEAMVVFGDMIREGIKANDYTFASILISCGNLEDSSSGRSIHGLIVKSGFESAVASQTSLLTMYAKCGLADDSLKVFKHFANPNQVSWTSLIVGLVQNSREEIALTKFRQMIRCSVIPNSFTFSGVIRACSNLAMLDLGTQIHAMLMKYRLGRDRYTGASLIDFYGKCGSVEMSRSAFDCLYEIDIVSVNSMIHSFAQNGLGHEALLLYNRMKDLEVEPNEVTLVGVLSACRSAGLVEEGSGIFASMESNHDIKPTRDHYACMVDILGRAGRLEEAETLITRVDSPDVVLWRTLLSACRIHREVEMAERVMSKVLELAPMDEGVHVLLSNLYASTGRWNQVAETKSTMREMKLKKSPAMSWVDVDREVHTFMAGDWSHPNSREIGKTLEELIQKVKNLGYVPDTRCVVQDLEQKDKERSLYGHSEKLAVAFALWRSSSNKGGTSIRILKNLRVCEDCHNWMKFVSRVIQREIVARDAKRFHHFRDGVCSCGDYW